MGTPAKIDVAVPCYQYGRFLRDCITSITSQPVDGLRVLIIDNGSTDDSAEVARELAAGDPRIELKLCNVNRGQNFRYNAAVDWAAAEHFMILDADDVLAPRALVRAVEVLDRNPSLAFCHGTELRMSFEPGKSPACESTSGEEWTIENGSQFITRLCHSPMNPVGTSTVVVRTAIQKQAGYYNPALPHTDDLEMWLRLSSRGDVAETKAVQAVRRVHPHQISAQFSGVHLARDCSQRLLAFSAFIEKDGNRLEDPRRLHRTVKRSVAAKAYWSGLSHVARGKLSAGADLIKLALAERPEMALLPPVDWLARMDKPWQRATDVISEMASGKPVIRNTGRY